MSYPDMFRSKKGFTLAELLIALAILGIIAVFTIPKVLVAQQDQKYNAIAKEAIGMVAGAYQAAQLNGIVSSTMTMGDLTQYMNYVSVTTSLAVDDLYGNGTYNCRANWPCLVLHNGATIHIPQTVSFSGTATTNAIWFHIDPDGRYGGTTNGPGKSVPIFLYYNGRMTDEGKIFSGTVSSDATRNPDSGFIPPWFSWD